MTLTLMTLTTRRTRTALNSMQSTCTMVWPGQAADIEADIDPDHRDAVDDANHELSHGG